MFGVLFGRKTGKRVYLETILTVVMHRVTLLPRKQINMTLQNKELLLEFTKISLRYEQKTAAIHQSMLLFVTAQIVAETQVDLKNAFEKFEDYLKPYSLDHRMFFCGLLLFSLIAEVEIYFVDIMKSIIRRHPKKVGAIEFKLSDILDSSPEELITAASESHLNRLIYKKPSEYLGELMNVLSIDKGKIEQHWPTFVEAKARRDLGTHNNWLINDTYRKKVAEVGLEPPLDSGLSMCPDNAYIMKTIIRL